MFFAFPWPISNDDFTARKSRDRFSLSYDRCKPTAPRPANTMPSEDTKETECDERVLEHYNKDSEASLDPDTEFGGTEARKRLERKLLFKLDARMSILVVIYLLNCVSCTLQMSFSVCIRMLTPRRLTGTTRGERKRP